FIPSKNSWLPSTPVTVANLDRGLQVTESSNGKVKNRQERERANSGASLTGRSRMDRKNHEKDSLSRTEFRSGGRSRAADACTDGAGAWSYHGQNHTGQVDCGQTGRDARTHRTGNRRRAVEGLGVGE